MTEIITLIGDPGGGKSSLAGAFVKMSEYVRPDMPRFTNTKMGGATTQSDLHKFIAIKLIQKNRDEFLAIDDEAAQSGLEARGSGTKGAAIESRIITHSRKAGAWMVLISQLKSMLDKRAQWVEELSILCESVFEAFNTGIIPDYFHYTVFDSKLEIINEFDIDTIDFQTHVWPEMDTYDIPDFGRFRQTFINYYGITRWDIEEFNRQVEEAFGYAKAEGLEAVFPKEVASTMEWHSRKALIDGMTVRLEDGRYMEVHNRFWDEKANDWGYSGTIIGGAEGLTIPEAPSQGA